MNEPIREFLPKTMRRESDRKKLRDRCAGAQSLPNQNETMIFWQPRPRDEGCWSVPPPRTILITVHFNVPPQPSCPILASYPD
jgi:hypothetical protein